MTVLGLDRARVVGGGKKVFSSEMEQRLFDWVIEERHHRRRVTRKSIKRVASELVRELDPAVDFRASSGWCNNFMTRFNLSTRVRYIRVC